MGKPNQTEATRQQTTQGPHIRRSNSHPAPQLSPPKTARYVLAAAVLVLLVSPTEAYFMKCKQFCAMLTQDELKQLWCVYDMCRNEKLGRHILRYAKRGWGGFQPDLLASSTRRGADALLDSSSSHLGQQQWSSVGQPEYQRVGGDRRGDALLQSIVKAREDLQGRRPLPPVEDKRDIEYWDGPAPADINA